MAIVTAGFDLARNVFAVHGADEVGMPTPVRPVVNASPCLSFPMPGTLMIQPIKSEALATLKQVKYWPPVGRVDNVYGDRNLFCGCVPVADDAQGKTAGVHAALDFLLLIS